MFCTNCGSPVQDDMRFCTNCGAPIQAEFDQTIVEDIAEEIPTEKELITATASEESVADAISKEPVAQTAQTAQMPSVSQPVSPQAYAVPTTIPASSQTAVMPIPATAAQQVNNQQPKKSKSPLIIIIVALVVIAITAVLAGVFFLAPQDEKQETSSNTTTETTKLTSVSISISGTNYSSASCTPVCVMIEGTDDAGKDYSKGFDFDGSSTIDLAPGRYKATPLASPISDSGTLYTITPSAISFVVSATGVSESVAFQLTPIPAADLTDSQLDAAMDAAESAGISASELIALHQKAIDARNDAKEKASDTWYVCASDFVTLRSRASTSASAITRINSREPVKYVRDAGSGWSEVAYNGKTGYVLTRFISKDKNAPLDYGDV